MNCYQQTDEYKAFKPHFLKPVNSRSVRREHCTPHMENVAPLSVDLPERVPGSCSWGLTGTEQHLN